MCRMLIYQNHVSRSSSEGVLFTFVLECPFQNPEIANHPDADQKINFDPPGYSIYSSSLQLYSSAGPTF